jgi:hypothetical protein
MKKSYLVSCDIFGLILLRCFGSNSLNAELVSTSSPSTSSTCQRSCISQICRLASVGVPHRLLEISLSDSRIEVAVAGVLGQRE